MFITQTDRQRYQATGTHAYFLMKKPPRVLLACSRLMIIFAIKQMTCRLTQQPEAAADMIQIPLYNVATNERRMMRKMTEVQ